MQEEESHPHSTDYKQVNLTKPIGELDYDNFEVEWG